jgi:hypothetical protein
MELVLFLVKSPIKTIKVVLLYLWMMWQDIVGWVCVRDVQCREARRLRVCVPPDTEHHAQTHYDILPHHPQV